MEHANYQYRQIARLTVEAETPVAVSSGQEDIVADSVVVRDVNGLPYIPATSIAGVVRHSLGWSDDELDAVFGYQKGDDGHGSNIVFTDAVMVGEDGAPLDGLRLIDWNAPFYAAYRHLPLRQHVRIGDCGVAENTGKFDREVVYKGTRFVFEMELMSDTPMGDVFAGIMQTMSDESLRIGGGTRCGHGRLRVVDCLRAQLNLEQDADLALYLSKSSCLSLPWEAFAPDGMSDAHFSAERWTKYELDLMPADFFMFASGMGDDTSDNVAVTESVVCWKDGKPALKHEQVLIPASSVKGALAHRTAYHYNKVKGWYVGNDEAKSGCDNKAVADVFGSSNGSRMTRGHILIDDVIEGDRSDKLFAHVKIDCFTGGAVHGALFQEKVMHGAGRSVRLNVMVSNEAFADNDVQTAFERSLKDVCDGLLPLGGVTNRGNGVFGGKLLKNGVEI